MLRTLFFQIVFHFWSCVAETEGNFKVSCVCRAERSKRLIDLNRLENDLIAIFLNLSVVFFIFLFDSCSKLVPLFCFTLFILMHKSFYTFILSVVVVLTGSEIKELLFGIFILGKFVLFFTYSNNSFMKSNRHKRSFVLSDFFSMKTYS